MKTLARAAFTPLVLVLAAALPAPAHAAKYKIDWLLAHNRLDYLEEATKNFKAFVEKGSKGEIEVNVVTDEEINKRRGRPGEPVVIASAVEAGEAQMGHAFTESVGALDHRLWAFDAPYLFRDYRHMEGVIEGPAGTAMLEGLRAHHIVGLALTYSGGARGVASVKRELRAPKDLKGLKVGVYGNAVDGAWLKALGAVPVPIEHRLSSIRSMAKAGQLDAVAVTWRDFEREELESSFKTMNLLGSSYLVSVTFINEKFYASLPERHRALLKKAALEMARIERAQTIELNEDSKATAMARGARMTALSEEGRLEFARALQPAYERSINGLVGEAFIGELRRAEDRPVPSARANDFARR